MNETRYLVDNNAVAAIKSGRVRSQFFRDYCQVTSDVLWEAEGHPEEELLKESAIEVTVRVLENIRAVMSTMRVGDTQLVDLYKNKGAADPGLIASALDSIASEDRMLFADTWVLVTNDRAVLDKAAEFGIRTIKPQELSQLVDADS
jgi:hypothetical protein